MAADSKSWLPSYGSSLLTRRRFLKGAAAGAGAVALIACGGGSDSGSLKLDDAGTARQPGTVWFKKDDWRLADEIKQAVRGGIYRSVRTADLPSHLDPTPQVNTGVPTAYHTYELLMARNRGPGIQPGTEAYTYPVGALAESWEISADGTVVTFRMRQGVKWQNIPPVNGRVMTIDDWKTSHERHMAVNPYRAQLVESLEKVEYPDARTMVWKFKFPYVPIVEQIFDRELHSEILPRELNANPAIAETTAIGTGYKILDKHEPSVTVEYRKNPDYWGGDPFIDRWHEPIIPEYANRYAQFVSGNIIDFTPTARDVLNLHKDASQSVVLAEDIPIESVGIHKWGKINAQSATYKDERVRIAFRRSIDYQAIARLVSNQSQLESAGIPIEIKIMTLMLQDPAYWLDPEKGELGEFSQNYLYDVAEAKKLASAAGFSGPIPLEYFQSSGTVGDESEDHIKKFLDENRVFDAKWTIVPAAEYRTRINVDGQFTGVQTASSGSGRNVDYLMFRHYHSAREGGVAFPDPKVDAFAEAQRKEVDFEKRNELLREVQRYLSRWFYQNPGRSVFTTFSFRWPWVHNTNYYDGSPFLGGQLRWLDEAMPKRNERV
jgi:ABC-type transport system substrate-binding protein